MHIDLYQIGASAVELLTKIMNKEETDKHITFASEFVKRGSTL